jgi:hypothetical protein
MPREGTWGHGEMIAPRRRTKATVFGGFAVMVAAIGFAAAYYARLPTAPGADLSASQNIDFRFPDEWRQAAASPPGEAFASTDALWFQPTPLYPIMLDSDAVPPAPDDLTAAVADVAAKAAADQAAKPSVATAKRRSNAVLSDAQIAGIKKRLNLTSQQERYWPSIAAELRKMEYKKEANAQGPRTASIDTSKVDVAKLRSAGLPLVMSFDDEQKDEFKGLVHLLGIESTVPGL